MASRRVTKRRRVRGNTGTPAETRYAVYKTTVTYRGELAGKRGVIPRHGEVSLPPEQHKQAEADGFEFVRWARGG